MQKYKEINDFANEYENGEDIALEMSISIQSIWKDENIQKLFKELEDKTIPATNRLYPSE